MCISCCAVLCQEGVPIDQVNHAMRLCIAGGTDRYLQTLRRTVVWMNKTIDKLGKKGWAQINCDEISSLYVLMNSDCEPTAKFKGKRVSGKYRVAVTAKRDIRDGEEITAGYGKSFWGDEGCPCPKCQARATTPWA